MPPSCGWETPFVVVPFLNREYGCNHSTIAHCSLHSPQNIKNRYRYGDVWVYAHSWSSNSWGGNYVLFNQWMKCVFPVNFGCQPTAYTYVPTWGWGWGWGSERFGLQILAVSHSAMLVNSTSNNVVNRKPDKKNPSHALCIFSLEIKYNYGQTIPKLYQIMGCAIPPKKSSTKKYPPQRPPAEKKHWSKGRQRNRPWPPPSFCQLFPWPCRSQPKLDGMPFWTKGW